MVDKKRKKARGSATEAGVRNEMGKPRIARSARIAALNQDTTRIPEQPSTVLPGTVEKIIPSHGPSQPERRRLPLTGPTTVYAISELTVR